MLEEFKKRFAGAPKYSWIAMLFCKVRQKDKEDMLRKEYEICRSDPNFKLDMKTQGRYYMFLKPEEFLGPRVKDQTPSQILEMLDCIYDRMQYF